jgi:hypothetical protein
VTEIEEDVISEETPRREFLGELEQFANEHPSLTAPELARAFGRLLPERNLDLVVRLLQANAYALLAAEFRARFARQRHEIFASLDIPNAEPSDEPPPRIVSVYEKITQWREFVPDRGHRLLLEMTKREIHAAWQTRTSRMLSEAWRAEVLRRIDTTLELPEDLVSDHFSAVDIANLIQTVRGEMYRGNLRLRINVVPMPSRRRNNE